MRIFIAILVVSMTATSCKTYSYFASPNDLSNEYCQLHLVNGSVLAGKTTIQFETGQTAKKVITVLTKDNGQRSIDVADIKYYTYNNESYYPKELDLETYEIPGKDKLYVPNVHNLLFVREVTAPDSKIHLFELFKPRANSMDGVNHYDYYLSLDSEDRFIAWSIRGSKLFPDFESKMSSLVSDCPGLVEKIKQRGRGYSLRQVSIDSKKEEVVKKIVGEYNNCK